ncbi:MAG: glycosyltransferase, partial [Rhodospirillaceae bacterium]|nr:glycosyltransferase [Rhodospirillaceae bacterium]
MSRAGWRRTDKASDDTVARMIEEDRIDILVDLAGHTKGNRLPVLARKPAPVQMSYLGYPTTTGMAAVDYKLSDAYLTPPSTPERYAERILNLPDSFLCYAPPSDAPVVAPAPVGRPVTFGSFNATAKISEPVVALWSRLLRDLPDTRLILKTQALDDPATRDRYLSMFATHGVASSRLDLRGHDGTIGLHLAQYGEIDIALDPFPYNGGTTTLEALWMGVPVLTLVGDHASARHGLSILATVGLSDLASRTPEAFLRAARSLAGDAERRTGLRAELRERVAR